MNALGYSGLLGYILNVSKELNSSRMAASSPWRESYWRNVSYVEGLLCAAEVITIFIISSLCLRHNVCNGSSVYKI